MKKTRRIGLTVGALVVSALSFGSPAASLRERLAGPLQQLGASDWAAFGPDPIDKLVQGRVPS